MFRENGQNKNRTNLHRIDRRLTRLQCEQRFDRPYDQHTDHHDWKNGNRVSGHIHDEQVHRHLAKKHAEHIISRGRCETSNAETVTCFSGPRARSHDFLMISRLDSLSFESSVPFWPADWLYPGGLTLSADFSCLFLKHGRSWTSRRSADGPPSLVVLTWWSPTTIWSSCSWPRPFPLP